jgi:hypothetical protein
MAVYLARNCPRCGNFWGVAIAKPDGSGSQSIHGRCGKCGYEIAWAIIGSKSSSQIDALTAGSKGADA